MQLRPCGCRAHVDRGVLPDRASHTRLHEFVRTVHVEMPFGLWLRLLRLRGRGVACDQAETLHPRVQPVAAQDAPHPVGRKADPSPLGTCDLRSYPRRAEAGMAQRECGHPYLHHRGDRVRHAGAPAFPGPEDLHTVPLDLPEPPIIGRGMDTVQAARRTHVAKLTRCRKHPHAGTK